MEYIYGALLLHKLGKPVDEEHLHKVISATGAHVDESKVKSLIASLNGVDIAHSGTCSSEWNSKARERRKERRKSQRVSCWFS